MGVKSLKYKISQRSSVTSGFVAPKKSIRLRQAKYDNVVVAVNVTSAPLEFLISEGEMATKTDHEDIAAKRIGAAMRLRSLLEGSQTTVLKSPNMDAVGGTGSYGNVPQDHKIDCMKKISKLREDVNPANFKLASQVCYEDIWTWNGLNKRERKKHILAIHKAIDDVAVHFKYLTIEDYLNRWVYKRRASRK